VSFVIWAPHFFQVTVGRVAEFHWLADRLSKNLLNVYNSVDEFSLLLFIHCVDAIGKELHLYDDFTATAPNSPARHHC